VVIQDFTQDSINNHIVITITMKVATRYFLGRMDLITLSNNQHNNIQDITIKPKK